MTEEQIVGRFFAGLGGEGRAAPGDDCAMLAAPAGKRLALSTDTSIAGLHFPQDVPPQDAGWRCLAVALSDLAACGAEADFCLLALSLPEADPAWLEGFADGFGQCAGQYGVRLVGGDLVRGQLAASVQVGGWVAESDFLARDGGRAGDLICVTGQLGAAAAGLASLTGELQLADEQALHCQRAFLRPEPQLAAGQQLAGLASACIDLSDGLALDLDRLCRACGTGADLEAAAIPACPAGDRQIALSRALHGGDDYQLCFSLPPSRLDQLRECLGEPGTLWHRIGSLSAEPGLRLDGRQMPPRGWEHFQ